MKTKNTNKPKSEKPPVKKLTKEEKIQAKKEKKAKRVKLSKKFKNIFYLLNPVWKTDKKFFFLTISNDTITSLLYSALDISYAAILLNMAISGASLAKLILAGIAFLSLWMVMGSYGNVFYSLYESNAKERMVLKIKRAIFNRGRHVDYKYIANPEFYDNYQFTIEEREMKSNDARVWIINVLIGFLTILMLGSFIAAVGPFILAIVAIKLIFDVTLDSKRAKLNVAFREANIKPNRRLDYTKRIFYQNDYATDLRTTALPNHIIEQYDEAGKEKLKLLKSYNKKLLIINILSNFFWQFFEFTAIIYLLYTVINGNIDRVPIYTIMITAYYQIQWRTRDFAAQIRRMNELSGYAERFRKYDAMKSEIEPQQEGIEPAKGKISLRLENATFTYENSKFGIKGINLDINAGEKIAIVGENGAGKSTLVKLLLRLYDLDEGSIKINGRNIKEYNVHKLRERVGVAFQDSKIYALPMKNNVNLYSNNIKESENLHFISEILEKNNATLDSELTKEFDKNGIMLSGGEIQKVALSRIINGDFGLLLLDEPSSALDPIAEYEMANHIMSAANNATTIMVAHRLSTVRDADKIVLIEDGQIKEVGNHETLMNLNGIYYEMFTKQAEKYEVHA